MIACVSSIFIWALGREYKRSLDWFEYHLCADPLVGKSLQKKEDICNSPSPLVKQRQEKEEEQREKEIQQKQAEQEKLYGKVEKKAYIIKHNIRLW